MSGVTVVRNALMSLLSVTGRDQHINGKPQKQVTGCIVSLNDKVLSTTSIVKDGKTSLSRFSILTDSEQSATIPVPDIDRMLGVLKHHGDRVNLDYKDDKVVIKSKNKQTTLTGGFGAKAFANSQSTLKEWWAQANERAKQIKGNVYLTKDGDTITPFFVAELPAEELHDALKCDGINGQKLNRYTFKVEDGSFTLTVGDAFKGRTTVDFGPHTSKDFSATFEGGLEHILRHYSNEIKLSFMDFTEYGQGIRLILTMENGDWVFQAGVL